MMDKKLNSEQAVLRTLKASLQEAYSNLQNLAQAAAENLDVWPEIAKFYVKASEMLQVANVLVDLLERRYEEEKEMGEIIDEFFEQYLEEYAEYKEMENDIFEDDPEYWESWGS
jgi:hypothetical protein